MIVETEIDDYRNSLEEILKKAWWPRTLLDHYLPQNSSELIEYNRWCLKSYLIKYYKLILKSVIPVLPIEDLKKDFYKRYNNSLNKAELIFNEKSSVRGDIFKILENKIGPAVTIYKNLNLGHTESIYKVPYTKSSHEVFAKYALVWDLVHYKVFLDQLSDDVEPENKLLNFDLTARQMEFLFNSLKGVYISSKTEINDFFAVFNLNRVEANNRISWIHRSSKNKSQLNRSTLFHLVIKLNKLDSYKSKQLKGEIYTFINKSFVDENQEGFTKLTEYHRNYKDALETSVLQPLTSIIERMRAL